MDKRTKVILAIIGIVIFVLIFGSPRQVEIYGFTWCIKDCNNNPLSSDGAIEPIKASDLLQIDELKPQQTIYTLNEKPTVDFTIKNDWNLPYNLTVNWLNNGTQFFGWYNESNISKPYYSYYSIKQIGIWRVQVILKWTYQNISYSKDSISELEVVS